MKTKKINLEVKEMDIHISSPIADSNWIFDDSPNPPELDDETFAEAKRQWDEEHGRNKWENL